MSGDEAVRKEFEAWACGPVLPLERDGVLYADYMTQLNWMTWQAARSAAIQECADKMRAMNHPVYADMILLALKER